MAPVVDLRALIAQRLQAGLRRAAIQNASKWAETYRMINGKPWSFRSHPWLRGMHDCTAEHMVGCKAAQMGFTETALNKSFYTIDILGLSVLYVLPASNPDASDFSKSRFDPALEESEHLKNMFSDVSNIGHKRAGSANLFIRGSRSRSQMKSIPASLLVFDERDEMVQDNVTLAQERASGQKIRQTFDLSTPTAPEYGIDADYNNSTMNHFFFRCPSCGRLTELIYPDCIVVTSDDITGTAIRDSHLVCKECKNLLPQETKADWLADGIWVPGKTGRTVEGFYINQLYSTVLPPYKIAEVIVKAQTSKSAEQELYNSKLGLARLVADSRLSDDDLNPCIKSYLRADTATGLNTIGIDIGPKHIHYVVMNWTRIEHKIPDLIHSTVGKMLNYGVVAEFDQLLPLFRLFNPSYTVIDANPERRQALAICEQFPGSVSLCIYESSLKSHELTESASVEHCLLAARTQWFDAMFERIRVGNLWLPLDTGLDFRNHLKAIIRINKEDAAGNPVGFYVSKTDDHYAHALNYAQIAFKHVLQFGRHSTITT